MEDCNKSFKELEKEKVKLIKKLEKVNQEEYFDIIRELNEITREQYRIINFIATFDGLNEPFPNLR